MFFALVAIGASTFLKPAVAMEWVQPAVTEAGSMGMGFSPKPTQSPGSMLGELRIRQNDLVPNNWCGFIGGDTENVLSCDIGVSCVSSGNVVGCCTGAISTCDGLFTSCVDLTSPCNDNCLLNDAINKCDAVAPFCAKFKYSNGLTQYGCADVPGLTTSVELLSDGLATTGSAAASSIPTSNSSPASSTTTVVLEPAATSDSSLSRHKKKKGVGIGGIVGIVVGVLALLGLIGVALVFFCFQHRKKRRGAAAAAASAQQKYNPVPQQMENLPPQQYYQPPSQVPYSPPVATGVMYDDKTGFNAAATPLQRDTTGGSHQSYVQGPEVPLFPGSPSPQPSVPAGRHLSADSAMFTAVSPMTGHPGGSGGLPLSPQVTGIATSRGITPQQTSSTRAPSLHASNNAGPIPEAYDHH